MAITSATMATTSASHIKVAIPSATNQINQIAVTNMAVPTVTLGKTSAHTMW